MIDLKQMALALAGGWRPWMQRQAAEPKYPASQRIPYVGRTKAGVYVNADRALRNATVWACARYLSQTVAQLPWHVFLNDGNAGGQPQPNHPLQFLLNKRPNPEWSAFQFRETLTTWALLNGNGCAEIERDAAGRPVALWPIHPERVTPQRNDAGALQFEISNGSEQPTILAAADLFHIRGFGDGPWGVDVMQYAAQSIGWAQATELFGAEFFGNGTTPQAVLAYNSSLSIPARELALATILAEIKKYGITVTDGEAKLQPWAVELEKAQFVATMQHQVEEVCRWFGVPPHKVMHLLRATFSNIEHQAIEVVVDTVMPWVKRFEQEADYKLVLVQRRFYTRLNLDGLLRGDAKSRNEALEIKRRNGVISGNEWRALDEMAPMGPGGDKYIVQSQYTTLEQVGEAPAVAEGEEAEAEDDEEVPEELAAAFLRLSGAPSQQSGTTP